ncbi:MAG TPA: flagellar hook-associated protein FlgK [Candidatus Competibacter sp.]|nr:flagellar hook-associated protein FlgK [Candidatus Competibacter sp.]
MVDILRTGLSGLVAFQRALATTSHNIANANTPGYSRQRVELTNSRPAFAGSIGQPIYVGTGVSTQSISRVHDDFLTQQVRNHGSNVGQSEAKSAWIDQLDGILGDSDTGLAPALGQFFGAVQDVADSPASTSARQALLGQAGTLAARFQELDGQMNTLREGANQSLRNTVGEINRLAENIAKANGAIALMQGNGGASPDLLDQRDQIVADLARRVSVSTVVQDDGTLSVFIGKGQTLVLGGDANALETVDSASDPRELDIRFKSGGSSINDLLGGGEIGGLLDFQKEVLNPAQNKLGLMAVGLTETFNAQHKLGLDLDGNPGGDFFAPISPEVMANAANAGSGTLTVTIANVSGLQPSDYELKYDGTNYSLYRLADDKVVATGAGPFTVDGMDIAINGTPAAGDRFLIQPTRNGAGDFKALVTDPRKFAAADAAGGVGNNGNALELAGLQTGKTLLNSSSSLQDVQGQMVAEVGTQGNGAHNTLKAQQALLEQATEARDGFSGVNLDEEAANLMKYQQAYEAAAKVIQIGDSLIQSLLSVIGR